MLQLCYKFSKKNTTLIQLISHHIKLNAISFFLVHYTSYKNADVITKFN